MNLIRILIFELRSSQVNSIYKLYLQVISTVIFNYLMHAFNEMVLPMQYPKGVQ